MAGQKVTRRASIRRKSMRSPSVNRSSGSKTPRSVASEPNTSGKTSFNNSFEKLNVNDEPPANEVINKGSEHISYAAAANATTDSIMASSSELLASELAAIKITDSKEHLVQEETVESAPVEAAPVREEELVSVESANKSASSLNKLTRSNSKLGLDSVTNSNEGAKESTEELVAVAIDEPKAPEIESKEEENKSEDGSDPAADKESEAAAPVEETDEAKNKKCCMTQKAAKCRCIIS